MAKKNDVGTEDFDLDDFDFDIPEFDSPDVDTSSRSPITTALKGAVRGVKENITDSSTLRRFLSMALPEGYGLLGDTLDSAVTDTKDLYDKITGDSPEIIRGSKAFGRRVANKLGKTIPDKLKTKLDDALEDNDYSSPIKSDKQLREERENEEIGALNELMRSKTEVDEARYKTEQVDNLEEKGLEAQRHESSSRFLSSMNRGIARLVGYQDSINLKFQQKSLELQYRQYSTSKQLTDLLSVQTEKQYKILEQIKHNTALPEQIKFKNSMEVMSTLARERLLGGALNTVSNFTQNYRKQAMENISGMVQGFISPLKDAHSMTEGMDKRDLAGWALGKEASDALINHAGMALNPIFERSDKLKRGSEVLKENLTGIPQKLNEYAQSATEGTGTKSMLTQVLKSLMPKFSLDARAGGEGIMAMDEIAGFDKISRRTLIEVIPGHLADIAHWTKAAVTGEIGEKNVFSAVRGGFTTETEHLKDARRQIMSSSERDSLRTSTEEFLKTIGGDQLSSKAQRVLKRKILDEVANGKDLKPDRLADPANYDGEDPEAVDEINSLLVDTFNLDWSGKMTDQSTEGKAKFNETRQQFLRLASMVPAIGDRVRILSDTMGKDTFRKLGYVEHNGREDRINHDKILDGVFDDEETPRDPSPPGDRKIVPRVGGDPSPAGGGLKQSTLDLIRAAIGGDRVDDAAGKKDAPRPSRVNLDKYLGEKSQLIGLLVDSHQEQKAIHAILAGWQLTGMINKCCGEQAAPIPADAKRNFMDRFGKTSEAAKSLFNRAKDKVKDAAPNGSGLLGSVGKIGSGAFGLASGAAKLGFGGAKLAAKGYLGALKGSAKLGWGATKGMLGLGGVAASGLGSVLGGANTARKWLGDKLSSARDTVEEESGPTMDKAREKFANVRGKVTEMAEDVKSRAKNLYLKGEKSPRLQEWKLKAGAYRDRETGNVIRKWDDIKGDVVEGSGNVVLRYEEFVEAGGLTDVKGRMVKKYESAKERFKEKAQPGMTGAVGKLSSLTKAGASFMTAPYRMMGRVGMAGIRKAMKFFGGGKAGADVTSQLTGDPEKDMVILNTRQAQVQHDIFSLLKSKLGEETRKGSWKEIFKKRDADEKVKKDAAAERKWGGPGLFSKGGMLAGLLGPKKGKYDKSGEPEEKDDDGFGWGDAADLLGGGDEGGNDRENRRGRRRRRRGPRPRPRGRLGRLWHGAKGIGGRVLDKMGNAGKIIRGVGKVAGFAGKTAWKVGKFGLKAARFALNNPLTRFALKGGGRLALGALAGAGSLISAPVIGVALGAWTAYEIGSWMWSLYKDRLPPLARLRFAQYGLTPRKDTKNLDKAFALEKLFTKHARVEESGKVSINMNAIPAEEFGAVLGFKVDPNDEASMAKLKKAMTWINGRFKTTFSAHLAQLYKLNKSMSLEVADQKVIGQQTVDFLDAVRLADASSQFDDMTSPFEEDLSENSSGVESWFKSARGDAVSAAKDAAIADKNKPVQDAAATIATATIASAQAAGGKNPDGSPMVKPAIGAGVGALSIAAAATAGKFTPTIGLNQALAGGAHVVSPASMVASPAHKRLDYGNPVRYKTYGLTELAESKVVQLAQLESESWGRVKYDDKGSASINHEGDLYAKAVEIFGLAGKNQDDAYVWFYRRYLVAFLKYCSAVRARANIDAKDAVTRLSNDELLAVLKEMVSATTSDGKSVWEISESPWEGYWLNADRTSVDANLTGLAQRTTTKVLSEDGFQKASQVKGADGKAIEVDPSQTNRPAGTTSTTTGVMAPNAADKKESEGGLSGWFSNLFGDKNKPPQQGGMDNSNGTPKSPTGIFPMGGGTSTNTSQGALATVGGGYSGRGYGATSIDVAGPVNHMGGGGSGDVNAIPTPTGDGWEANKGTILAAAKMVGVDPELASSIAGVESNYVPTARPYSKKQGRFLSSAAGYYQVIKDTWKSLMNRYGDKYGINPKATAMDPRANAILGLSYVKENYDILKSKIGRKVTDTDVYLAHFLGSGGAKRFLVAPPGDPAINHVSPAQASSNEAIFYGPGGQPKTVAEVYNGFSEKLQKHRKPNAAQEMAAITGMGIAPGAEEPVAESAQGAASPEVAAPAAPAAAPTGGGGSFDPANSPAPAPERPPGPSLAQPAGSNLSKPTSVMEPPPTAAVEAASTSRVSQAAQNISRQAEMANVQSSGQEAAISNTFGGVEGVLRESLEVAKGSYSRLGDLVRLVTELTGASAVPDTSAKTPTRQSAENTATRPAPRGVVKVSR